MRTLLFVRLWRIFTLKTCVLHCIVCSFCCSGKRPYDDDVGIIPLKVKHEKQLPFDATDAGPGTDQSRDCHVMCVAFTNVFVVPSFAIVLFKHYVCKYEIVFHNIMFFFGTNADCQNTCFYYTCVSRICLYPRHACISDVYIPDMYEFQTWGASHTFIYPRHVYIPDISIDKNRFRIWDLSTYITSDIYRF